MLKYSYGISTSNSTGMLNSSTGTLKYSTNMLILSLTKSFSVINSAHINGIHHLVVLIP